MRIVFMGTPESAVPSLRRLLEDGHEIVAVWTQPDKPVGRGKKLQAPPVKQFAVEHHLPIHQPTKIETHEAKALFTSHDAEVAVVVAYGRLLPDEFLSAPARGAVNVHFSLLPKYRGAAPVNWAIVNGETSAGVTTMQIVQELDAGSILLQRSTSIGEHETAPQLLARLAEIGADLLSETLRNLSQIEPRPQSDAEVSFAPILKREDGIIDWSMSGSEIERRVRGFQPWPTAFTTLDSRRLIIWNARATGRPQSAPAGTIIEATRDRLTVACGEDSALQILDLQAEGGRQMAARDFLNGTKIEIGTTLGSAASSPV